MPPAPTMEQRVKDLTRELEQRKAIAESLTDIMTALNSDRSLTAILEFIIEQAGRLLGTDTGAVWHLDESAGCLTIQAARGLPLEQMAGIRVPVGQGAVGRAVLRRAPVAVTDVAAFFGGGGDPRMGADQRTYLTTHYKALLAVPLIMKGEVYGGVALYYLHPREFTIEETSLAMTYGGQAALAIENARLRARAEQDAVAAERNRLARDLHDAVTQTLFSTSLIAEVLPLLWKRDPAEGHRRLEDLRQLTRGALAEMRALLVELRPAALAEAKLADLLRQMAEAATNRAGIDLIFQVEGEARLSPDVQVALYRIAQEALNNVAKHAGATTVELRLTCEPNHVRISIADNGRGFDPAAVPPEHLGLGIMRERAAAIGAAIHISSRPGEGTALRAEWRKDQ